MRTIYGKIQNFGGKERNSKSPIDTIQILYMPIQSDIYSDPNKI